MDYLVFGVGFGSTLVLIGWVLRQFGPSFRYRDTPDDVLSAEEILERNDWQRFCIAMGALLSVCGAVILLATLLTLLVRPSDTVGTIIVGSLFVISLLAVAAWIVLYVNQHRALAGDRRAEVTAAMRTRKPAQPRQARTPATAKATSASTTDPPEPTTAKDSTEGLEALERRRKTVQQQRAASAAEEPDASTRQAPPSQPEPTTEAPVESAPATTTTTTPAPAIADPTQALRNVQFKRAGTNRSRDQASSKGRSEHAEGVSTARHSASVSESASVPEEPATDDDASPDKTTPSEADA
ncbi:MAG: hypothetical protein QM589_06545 [Thermomicrobiales bacterium]